MHELAAVTALLQVALDTAIEAGARRVLAVDIVVGDLTSMVDDSVQFYFDLLSRDTAAAGAVLRFRREPAIAACRDCGGREPVRPPLSPMCAHCGSHAVEVTGGRQFHVESVEVSDEGSGRQGDPEGE
jgi:hydrogenase nickel incorporation protein HypA/HybF